LHVLLALGESGNALERVPRAFPRAQLDVRSGVVQLPVEAEAVALQQVPGAGGEDGGDEAVAVVGEQGGCFRIGAGCSQGVGKVVM
jgi:hypothetical protein